MKVYFEAKELADMYHSGAGKYLREIIIAFIKKVDSIDSAKDERDLRKLKSNHFEKLKGYQNLYSIRLNDKYRLEFSIEKDGGIKIISIKRISDHYS